MSRSAIETVEEMIRETIAISHEVLDSGAAHHAFSSQRRHTFTFLGPNPHNQSLRRMMDSAVGQRLEVLSEVKSVLMEEEMRRLEREGPKTILDSPPTNT